MQNEVILGDCLTEMAKLKDGLVDAIVTDPPYKYLKNQKLETDFDEDEYVRQAKRVLKKDGMIAFFGCGTSCYRLALKLEEAGFKFKEEIVWDKRHVSSPVTAIGRMHELCIIMGQGNSKINKQKISYYEMRDYDFDNLINDVKRIKSALNNANEFDLLLEYLQNKKVSYNLPKTYKNTCTLAETKTIRNVSRVQGTLRMIVEGMTEKSVICETMKISSYNHPTQKPDRLLERIISLVSKENDLILDTFGGSGTANRACYKIKRNCIGIELDKEYHAIANQMLNETMQQFQIF